MLLPARLISVLTQLRYEVIISTQDGENRLERQLENERSMAREMLQVLLALLIFLLLRALFTRLLVVKSE